MIYFDNAATTLPKSKGALRAYKKAFQSCGNASRGGHPFAARASEHLYLCRERLAERFGTEPERVVLTMNATHAINLAVKGLIREGDVLISDLEHNAVYRPLYALEKQGRIRIRVFHADLDDDEATVRRFRAALDENVRACVVTHASNICGRVLPLAALSEAARQAGVPLICDASQTAGHFDLQLRELPGVTALCMPGHKGLYGPLGTGALLVSPFFGGSFETLLEGGSGSFSADPEMPALLPERLEAGTMNAPAFAGLAAAVAEKSASGKEEQIFSYLLSGLRETEGVTLYGAPRRRRTALLSDSVIQYRRAGQRGGRGCAGRYGRLRARGPALFAAGPPRARHPARRRGPHQPFQAQHVRGGRALFSNSGPPESPLKRQSGDYSRRYTRLRRESRRRKAGF